MRRDDSILPGFFVRGGPGGRAAGLGGLLGRRARRLDEPICEEA